MRLLRLAASVLSWVCQLFFKPDLVVEYVDVKIPSLTYSSMKQLKVVQLTDFHYDPSYWPVRCIDDEMLDKVVSLTNNEKADLVFLTGDYVDKIASPVTNLAAQWLSKLKAKHGVYAVLGNHDYKNGQAGQQLIVEALESANIRVLGSELCYPIPGDSMIELIGLGDMHSPLPDFDLERAFEDSSPDPKVTRLVMSHTPDSAALFVPWKIDLQFSGHTHGGQICWPWGKPVLGTFMSVKNSIWPGKNRRKKHGIKNWDWIAGYHQVPRNKSEPTVTRPLLDGHHGEDVSNQSNGLYVSRGLATHPPCRILCPPELTVFNITYK